MKWHFRLIIRPAVCGKSQVIICFIRLYQHVNLFNYSAVNTGYQLVSLVRVHVGFAAASNLWNPLFPNIVKGWFSAAAITVSSIMSSVVELASDVWHFVCFSNILRGVVWMSRCLFNPTLTFLCNSLHSYPW